MPFGPAPAPAEMQSYVATRFGGLKDRDGALSCSPCMYDIKVSSASFEKHIDDVKKGVRSSVQVSSGVQADEGTLPSVGDQVLGSDL